MQRSDIPIAIAWLLGHGLLLPANGEVVVVAREVSLFLRGGAPLRRFVTEPPAVVTHKPGTARDVRRGEPTGVFVDLTPLGAVDAIAQIGSTWQRTNPPALRSGGVAVRDVRATAKQLGVDDATAARLIELGAEVMTASPTETTQWVVIDRRRWASVIQRAGKDIEGNA